jgi:molybdopterin-guanine dinucleotide biosynthesis protein A
MGRDKAFLPAGEGTLIERLVHRLGPVVDETIVAAGPHPAPPGIRRIDDRFPAMGPLAGIHAGLLDAANPLVWVVACDLPDVEPGLGPLLRGLAEGVEAVVPLVGDEPEGVCALYDRSLAPRVEGLLRAGHRRVQDVLARSDVRYVTAAELRQADPDLRSFRNLNTPADYDAWLRSR